MESWQVTTKMKIAVFIMLFFLDTFTCKVGFSGEVAQFLTGAVSGVIDVLCKSQ